MIQKRVLLLSEGFGAGHTQAARALAVSLQRRSANIQTHVLELGSFLHPTLSPWILSVYRRTITIQPKLFGIIYRNQYHKSFNRLTQLAIHRTFYTQTAAILRKFQPHMIVCTHPLPSAVISRLKRLGLRIPLCTVITDYDAHGIWVSTEVNKYLVSTPEVKQQLLQHGVPPSSVEVTGIPVHPSFWARSNQADSRHHFGLKNMPTVLVMGGGWGLVDNKNLFAYMANWRQQLQLIFCMGHNDKSRQKLAEDPLFRHEHIHILGFTEEIDRWMDVSDLLITKPGGMTCTEGLTKRIPMLFYSPIPGQEEENCQYFINQGYGERLHSNEVIERWFTYLTLRTPILDKVQPRIAPTNYAQAIVELLG